MDFFEHDVENGFDRMFDLDRDGRLDRLEHAMQLGDSLEEEEYDDDFDDDFDDDCEDEDYDEF